MKYFFSLLLLITLNISFSYGADPPKDAAEEIATKTESAVEELSPRGIIDLKEPSTNQESVEERTATEDPYFLEKSAQPPQEKRRRNFFSQDWYEDPTSASSAHFPDSWGDTSLTLPLEKTSLGQAIIEGDIETYKAALIELKTGFNVELTYILQMKTTDEKSLMDLMISTEVNRDFFTREMMRLLMITSGANTSDLLAITNSLLSTAKEVKNNTAFESLMAFQDLIAKFESDQIGMKNFIVDLLNKPRHRFKVLTGTTYAAVGTLVTVLGYKVFTSTLSVSIDLSKFIAFIPPAVTNNIDTIAGAGTAAAGIV